MKTSEQIGALATALSAAQGKFVSPPRNREVKVRLKDNKGEYTFRYTTLDCLIDMVRPALAENGLSFTQSVSLDENWVIVTTRLMHGSGQWIEDELPVKPEGFGPQQVGSAITYGKRYQLASFLGVASDEDDDGNLGSGHTSEEIKREPPPKRNGKAQQIADQHGMITADKLPAKGDKPAKSAYQLACEGLTRVDSKERLKLAEDWIAKQKPCFTEAEWLDLAGRIADADQRVSEGAAA